MQPLKSNDLEKVLEKSGFVFIRMGKGHAIYKRGTETVSVPRHAFIKPGTFHQICRKAGLDKAAL